MTKLVLFDIDGTLIRTGGAGVKAFACAFATEFGLEHGTEKLQFAGRTDVSLVREFFHQNQIEPTPDHFARFFRAYLGLLEETILQCHCEICPGMTEFMAQLRALPVPPVMGLLTGNLRRGAEIKLSRLRLWGEFAFGAFADDHEDRDSIAAIAKKRGADCRGQNVRDEEVLVIGDTPLDIRCARAINAKVLAVGTGGVSLDELNRHQPDWCLENMQGASAQEICG